MNDVTFEPTTIDHLMKNHHMVRDIRSNDFEKAKRDIDSIYKQLGAHRITNGDAKRLKNISGFLSCQVKEKFMKVPMHAQLTQHMKVLNEAMLEFQRQLLPYKQELAKGLQNIFECYNVIFIKQYETFFKSNNDKEKYLL